MASRDDGGTLFADVVAASEAVRSTPARLGKIGHLSALLARLAPDEVKPVIGFLSGEPRQGRIGVGWATLSGLESRGAGTVPVLTVGEVDRAIDAIEAARGERSGEARRRLLNGLLGRATPAEGEFFWRLLTGELRQGALAGLVTEAVAKAAGVPSAAVRRACMLSGDLGTTARLALVGGRAALDEVGLQVMRPVQPMLASTAPGVAEAIADLGLSSVEWKLDGIRVQVHRSGGEVAVYTRNLNDITGRVPDVVAAARAMPAAGFVLDGEALLLGGGDVHLVPRFFDCLHLDGEDLIDRPLTDRLAALGQVAGRWRIPGTVTDDPAVGRTVLVDALAARHEGVVVKAAGSTYEAGRRGKSWRKVKEAVTFDLVVLGAEWGHGRRTGFLSNLHLGARDPATGGFVMVGKTFKGLTDKLLAWQTERFLELETHRAGITVFIRPAVVVEIALDGVQRSTRYPGGVALRFARVKRYRDDKSPEEADTLDAVRALLHGAAGADPLDG
jgi:DNA ligase-1